MSKRGGETKKGNSSTGAKKNGFSSANKSSSNDNVLRVSSGGNGDSSKQFGDWLKAAKLKVIIVYGVSGHQLRDNLYQPIPDPPFPSVSMWNTVASKSGGGKNTLTEEEMQEERELKRTLAIESYKEGLKTATILRRNEAENRAKIFAYLESIIGPSLLEKVKAQIDYDTVAVDSDYLALVKVTESVHSQGEVFDPQVAKVKAVCQLYRMKQRDDESVQEYKTRMESMVEKLKRLGAERQVLNPEDLAVLFLLSLNSQYDQIANQLQNFQLMSYSASKREITLDSSERRGSLESLLTPATTNTSGKGRLSAMDGRTAGTLPKTLDEMSLTVVAWAKERAPKPSKQQQEDYSEEFSGGGVFAANANADRDRLARTKVLICYFCKGPGHLSKDCPEHLAAIKEAEKKAEPEARKSGEHAASGGKIEENVTSKKGSQQPQPQQQQKRH